MVIDACHQALGTNVDTDECPCAVLIGTSLGDIDTALEAHRASLHGSIDERWSRSQPEDLARAVAGTLRLRGPRVTLSCACTSGASALGLALDWIRAGRISRALVAGVDSLNDFVLCGFSSLWALTSDTPKPFDRARTGMALGETAAAFFVESLESARDRGASVRALLSGYGASGDAVHITAPDRTGDGACRAMVAALRDAEWDPSTVDYLNVHATGSLYNDAMILSGIRTLFGEQALHVPISSVNPVTGHTLGAAGLAEAVATVLAMESGFIPPTPNLEAPEAEDMLLVRGASLERPVERALSLTTGFGGANTALALERPRGDSA